MAWILLECTSSLNPSPARVYGGGSVGWVNDISQALAFADEATADAFALAHRICADAVNTTQQSQTFNVSGNFTAPNNVTLLDSVECYGGGGGGQTSNATDGGGGGGGGSYAKIVNHAVTLAEVVPLLVGLGGAADADGALSQFRNNGTCLARPGLKGAAGVGGVGGLTSTSVGTTKNAGGNGGNGGVGVQGGGGGSSAGTAAVGGNGANGAAGAGGVGGTGPAGGANGGAGGNAAVGVVGQAPGGAGGGGGIGTKAGGAAANGRVVVTYTAP